MATAACAKKTASQQKEQLCYLPGICGEGVMEKGVCSSIKRAQPEKCDGIDNDCDNTTDNGWEVGKSCTLPSGKTGVLQCTDDGLNVQCK